MNFLRYLAAAIVLVAIGIALGYCSRSEIVCDSAGENCIRLR